MSILEKFRNKVFWFLDLFQSKRIKNHFDEIKYINENFNSEDVTVLRNKMLNEILTFATQTTKFYDKYKNYSSLEDFPVVNKKIIRDNFKDFESSEYKDKKRYKVATSGSTGTPFVSYFDKNKKARNSADTIYFANKTGFKVGHKLLYIRFWGEQYSKSKLASWKQNIIPYNVTELRDEDIKKLIGRLESDSSTIGIVSYASAMESICKYLDKIDSNPIKSNIKSIILISESLNDYTMKSIIKYFGVKPVSRYSNSENGILAQQSQNFDNDFIINWASYNFEILKIDANEPVKFGETGRIVVTDLFNRAVPKIRYDTGDLGSMSKTDFGIVLNKLEGRIMDVIYDTSGEIISSHIVHQICVFEGINEYQLIQTDKKKYIFKIIASDGFVEDQLIESYKKLLGNDSQITVEYVKEIPLLKSGKRKKVLNLYTQIQ